MGWGWGGVGRGCGGLVVGRLRHCGDGPGRDGTGHGVGWGDSGLWRVLFLNSTPKNRAFRCSSVQS